MLTLTVRSRCDGRYTTSYVQLPRSDEGEEGEGEREEEGDQEHIEESERSEDEYDAEWEG